MKHIIILGDGMADHAVERLGGKTLLQYANKPYMDMLAKKGKTGRLVTVPDGFHPGSEVANSSIMGYDQNEVYEGRGPLEAASIGYEMSPNDFALRCNIINVNNGIIVTQREACQPVSRHREIHHRNPVSTPSDHQGRKQICRLRSSSRSS